MATRCEFDDLKSTLSSIITQNPILDVNRERFIFSKITRFKNRIFNNILNCSDTYSKFLDIVDVSISNGLSHEILMVGAFENSEDFDNDQSNRLEFTKNIQKIDKSRVLTSLKKYNISYDIFAECFKLYESCGNKCDVTRLLTRDMNYFIDKVYLSNVKIILRILSSYKNTDSLSCNDLFSEGVIGLRRAIELYNPYIGIKFSTYSTQWIKASISRAIADKDLLIRIPVNVQSQSKSIEKTRKLLRRQLHRDPSDVEVISHIGGKINRLSKISVNFSYYHIESNYAISTGDNKSESDDRSLSEEGLTDHRIIDEVDVITIKNLRKVIMDYLLSVDNKNELYYLQNYFGLNDDNVVKTKQEIMEHLKIGSNEYDNLKRAALNRTKKALIANKVVVDASKICTGWTARSNVCY